MRISVIGSAAGGGFPQWNCNAPLSRAVRAGDARFSRRTQSSLAVSADNVKWVLFNASPDIREQIAAFPPLSPAPDAPLRSTPIASVVLTNADVDHIAGLLSLREREPFILYATDRVLEVLDANPIFQVLNSDYVIRKRLVLGQPTPLDGPSASTGLCVEAFAVPGKVALFMEDDTAKDGNFGTKEGDTVGLRIFQTEGGDAEFFYIPGCAAITDAMCARLDGSACLLFDGTVFTDHEMQRTGVGEKTGRRMGHMPISGATGSIEALKNVTIDRRIFVHINNTNPVLERGSKAESVVLTAGWEVAYDGMEIDL